MLCINMKSKEVNTKPIDEKDLDEVSKLTSINKKIVYLLDQKYRVMEIARAIESTKTPGEHISKQRVVNIKKKHESNTGNRSKS